MDTEISLYAPAKINLTLDIKGKRPDGYHELESVMHQISLFDQVSIRAIPDGLQVYCDHPQVPQGEDNLAFRAARILLQKVEKKAGLEIKIKKNIPVGAGLAGGSTDAAAVLIGINKFLGLGLSSSELMELGAGLGSDIPFCIQGGTALARGRGEILTPLSRGPVLQLLLVKPDFSLSTAEIYGRFRMENVETHPSTERFLQAWTQCDIINVGQSMSNVLETVTLSLCPEIARIKEKMLEFGAIQAVMSGSGPTVAGVFLDAGTARDAYALMKNYYEEVFLASSFFGGDENGT